MIAYNVDLRKHFSVRELLLLDDFSSVAKFKFLVKSSDLSDFVYFH